MREKKEELANKSLNPYDKAVYQMVDRFFYIVQLSKKGITTKIKIDQKY